MSSAYVRPSIFCDFTTSKSSPKPPLARRPTAMTKFCSVYLKKISFAGGKFLAKCAWHHLWMPPIEIHLEPFINDVTQIWTPLLPSDKNCSFSYTSTLPSWEWSHTPIPSGCVTAFRNVSPALPSLFYIKAEYFLRKVPFRDQNVQISGLLGTKQS